MKINKDNFLEAVANAMMQDATEKLFKADPVAFDMFSLFSFAVFERIDGKDITEDDFVEAVANVIVDTLPDNVSDGTMLKDLALVIFSNHIWSELEKLGKPEEKTSETDKFKAELKSKITK